MFSSSSGKARGGRRSGKRARAGGSKGKRSKSVGSDDLHDFIHDIEFSAKKILKQHMQKRLTEATIEQRERRRRATGLSPPGATMGTAGGTIMGESQSLGSLHGKTGGQSDMMM